MASLMHHEHHSDKFKEISHSPVRAVNFGFGIFLFAIAFFFMFSRETLVGRAYHLDAFLLILAGFLSIRAGLAEKVKTIYRLNLSVAILFFISAAFIGFFRANDMEWVIGTAFDHTGGDLVIHTFFGIVFLYNALSCRQSKYPVDERNITSL